MVLRILIFRQQYDGIDVHGSEFTVNIDAAGQVINAGGRLYARPSAAAPSVESAGEAIRSALREVNPSADSSYLPDERRACQGRKDDEVRARRIRRID